MAADTLDSTAYNQVMIDGNSLSPALLAGVTVACAKQASRSLRQAVGHTDSNADGGPVAAAEPKASKLAEAGFPLGVASGDPLANRVML